MYTIKLINTNTNNIQYWTTNGSIRTMSMDKARYVCARLLLDMQGTAWVAEVVPAHEALVELAN